MPDGSGRAVAHPNIALIKYWGNQDDRLRLPSNGSISLTLGGLHTVTRVRFDPGLSRDEVTLHGRPAPPTERQRVIEHVDRVRRAAGMAAPCSVASGSDFPPAAGIASSASAFAALTLAAASAAGLQLSPDELSAMARRGSGSASRSIHAGFVEWVVGDDATSFARPLAPPEHWPLVDLVAVVDSGPKPVGSSEGHRLASTSPLQGARVSDAPRRLELCRKAILERDFELLAEIVEQDCHLMHGVMQTSRPGLLYWSAGTLTVIHHVREELRRGFPLCYTIDAGPNVHCLCPAPEAAAAAARLRELPGVQAVLNATAGGAARLIPETDPLTALL